MGGTNGISTRKVRYKSIPKALLFTSVKGTLSGFVVKRKNQMNNKINSTNSVKKSGADTSTPSKNN
ncbi:hypothetical protein [Paenibacillus periandrae]|uniref:hypothetical protein n=1 Tax=Paenibacillus periandrae TaxID=1761741 RepID=UPI001F08F2E6|nr:hypothetical protein [Paenibacillus periandrae]